MQLIVLDDTNNIPYRVSKWRVGMELPKGPWPMVPWRKVYIIGWERENVYLLFVGKFFFF